MAEVPKGLE